MPMPERSTGRIRRYSGSGPPRIYQRRCSAPKWRSPTRKPRLPRAADQWLMHEILASELLARAQLSGSYEDYAAAQRALETAFTVAVKGSGPHMMRASLDFSMHRLAGAESQLAAIDRYAVPPDPGDRAEIAAMRGDIAFYRGRLSGGAGRNTIRPMRSCRVAPVSAARSLQPEPATSMRADAYFAGRRAGLSLAHPADPRLYGAATRHPRSRSRAAG